MAVDAGTIADYYRNILGREGSESEIAGWTNAPDAASVEAMFYGSPEYAANTGGQATWKNDAQGNIVPTGNSGPGSEFLPQGDGSYGGGGRIEPVYGTPAGGGGGGGASQSGPSLAQQYNPGRLGAGFMYTNFVDPNMNTPKYDFARIASGYDATPSGLQAMVNDSRFKEAFPNARLVGKDSIDFGPGIGIVDVGAAFDDKANTGRSWQWLTADQAAGGASTGGQSLVRSSGGGGGYQTGGYGGPGSPGIYGNNGSPVQQVGQDPFSQLILGSIADLLLKGGASDNSADLMATLRDIISNGGALPDDGSGLRRFESARELMAKGERTATNDARAALADRGLLSTPGYGSGAESSTIGRIQTRNAEEFARALRDIGIEQDDANNTRLTNALSLAAGIDQNNAATLLGAIAAGGDRQQMLSQIALQSLAQNASWNQFLAQFGLDRDKALYDIQNGEIDSIMPYLTMFLNLAGGTARGYI